MSRWRRAKMPHSRRRIETGSGKARPDLKIWGSVYCVIAIIENTIKRRDRISTRVEIEDISVQSSLAHS